MRTLLGSIASFSLLALGCQSPTEVRVTNRPIFNGSPDNIATHRAVVALTDGSGFSFCTGTFVGNRTIVSAGHCFLGGAPVFIYFGNDPASDAANCANPNDPASCGFFEVVASDDPGFNANTLANDLSVIRISEDPFLNGQPVAPIPFTRFADNTNLSAADEGDIVSFSGFGITEVDDGGTKLVVGGIPLTAVGPDAATDIDGNQVFYNQPEVLGGPCSGDSGGPMFVTRNGVEFLAAVTSFGDQACTDFGVSTRVDTFEAFIETFCGAPNCGQGDPGVDPEVCNDNIDNDQDGDTDCDDSQCINNAACQLIDPEICNNGADDDGDGDSDCGDSDCADLAACQDQPGRFCAVTPASSSRSESPVVLLFALFGLSLVLFRRRS